MKHLKLLLAFGVGFMAAIALGRSVYTVTASSSNAGALESRIERLEATRNSFTSQVRAPFEVLDRSGKRIFYVNKGVVDLFNMNEDDVARIEAEQGGRFVATASGASSTVSLGAPGAPVEGAGQSAGESSALAFGLAITEGSETRVALGKRPAGNHSLIFNKGGQIVAALGETQEGSGQAMVASSTGVPKVGMNVSQAGKGQVIVTGEGSNILAALAEGDHGGIMFLCKPGGCKPPLVDAGDAGGYGLVRTGPGGFNPAAGSVGLGFPGSFIIGKR